MSESNPIEGLSNGTFIDALNTEAEANDLRQQLAGERERNQKLNATCHELMDELAPLRQMSPSVYEADERRREAEKELDAECQRAETAEALLATERERRERAEREHRETIAVGEAFIDEIKRLTQRADHAEAAAAAMREAIESDWFDCPIKGCGKLVRAVIETFHDSEGYSTHSELAFDCPNCEHGDDINDDVPDYWALCAARSERKRLAKKVATIAGTALLERLQKMETALSEIDAINLTYEQASLERAYEMQGIARAALGTEG